MPDRSASRWVLVTGGSGGIGSALCRQLALRGIRPVVGYCHRAEVATKLAIELEGEALCVDLADADSLHVAAAHLADRNLIGVVLNGSLPPSICRWTDATAEIIGEHWRTAVLGNHVLLSALIATCFQPRHSGTVVGVLSEAPGGKGRAMAEVMPYAIAKAGLQALLDTLAAEFLWLKVGYVRPSFTDTAMLHVFKPRMVDILRAQGRVSSPQDVAATIMAELSL